MKLLLTVLLFSLSALAANKCGYEEDDYIDPATGVRIDSVCILQKNSYQDNQGISIINCSEDEYVESSLNRGLYCVKIWALAKYGVPQPGSN